MALEQRGYSLVDHAMLLCYSSHDVKFHVTHMFLHLWYGHDLNKDSKC